MEKMDLNKYTVVDFTGTEAGPICSEQLAMLGMNVIRVDHPSAAEMDKDEKYYFVADNLNKKCITVDYDTEEGKALLRRIIAKADVFIENRPYGYMEKLGCGHEAMCSENPALIYCSIKPYPENSSWANAAWNPTTVDALGGATYLTGYVGGIPVEPGPQLSDISTCGYAAVGILGALWQREDTGKGQFMEVIMRDAVIAHARSAYEKYAVNGIVTRVGNNFPTIPDMVPMSLFRTKGEGPEDWAMIGCLGEKMVETLYHIMGRDDFLTNPKFDTFEHRLENKDELLSIIQEFALKYDKDDLMELCLGKNRLVSASVQATRDVVNSEDLKRIGFVQTVKDEELGDMNLPGFPAVYHDVEMPALSNPGRPGDANDEVLGQLFGEERSDKE